MNYIAIKYHLNWEMKLKKAQKKLNLNGFYMNTILVAKLSSIQLLFSWMDPKVSIVEKMIIFFQNWNYRSHEAAIRIYARVFCDLRLNRHCLLISQEINENCNCVAPVIWNQLKIGIQSLIYFNIEITSTFVSFHFEDQEINLEIRG